MICPNCGKELKNAFRFCTACGSRLEEITDVQEDEVTARSEPVQNFLDSFDCESEETMGLDHQNEAESYDSFENEETVVLGYQDEEDDYYSFENEETVILQDFEDGTEHVADGSPVYEEASAGLDDEAERRMHDYTTEIRLEDAPDYEFEGKVPVHKAPPSQYEQDTAYISHLRALKQLMDDGIITEEEFVKKKQQILGI